MKNHKKKQTDCKKIFLLIFVLCIGFTLQVKAQYYNDWDYHPPGDTISHTNEKGSFSENGLVHTPHGALKTLLVCVQFEGDSIKNKIWKNNHLPNYNGLFYSDINAFDDNNTDHSLSNFYYQMSKHSESPFKFYGEIFPALIKIPHPTSQTSFDAITRQVFDSIEANYPDFNWSSFDNRTNKCSFAVNNEMSSPDNIIDYVIISFRWTGGKDPWSTEDNKTYILKNASRNYTGWADITNCTINSNNGTYKIQYGFTTCNGIMGQNRFSEFFYFKL